ncbi:MAG: transcription initiation factor IIB [Candidatus Heimdallarchaeota archaeon]|nr:transcription initiation factor IIB [Candidatus Heimdallarchaeota archaeon]MDH5645718.1 transcription initiation factor IIB [Candidatus Heimdallarchaeota archaeon]
MSSTNPTTDKNKKTTVSCPDCGSAELIQDYNRGELICTQCGAVVDDMLIDDSPEWRAYSSEERASRSRVGSPTTYTIHDKGLSTSIGSEDRDAYGQKLSASKKYQFYRLRKWNTRSRIHSSHDRNLTKAMRELDRLSSQLSLPRSVKETGSIIYRKALQANLIRGRSIEEMIAAAIYAAARQRHLPRTLDEVAEHSRISKKELGRAYRLLVQELKLNIPLADPVNYVVRYAAELKLSGEVARQAKEILAMAKKKRMTQGKDPVSLAAASIYIAGILNNQQLTQQEIADIASVTEVTIRNRYKELVRELEIAPQFY